MITKGEAGPLAIEERLARIRARMADALAHAGRKPEEVTVVAASKFRSLDDIRAVAALGVNHFGENYPQEMLGKMAEADASLAGVQWHLIGGLQRNKVRRLARVRQLCIQSVDSPELAQALHEAREEAWQSHAFDTPLDILLQIGSPSHRGGRRGCLPQDLPLLIQKVHGCRGLRLKGLMGLPPLDEAPERYFEQLAAMRLHLARELGVSEAGLTLSMGMSHDFPAAIAAGATMVRLGEALFGPRLTRGPSHESHPDRH